MEIDVETDILRRFNNQYCPNLKGKPKFFMVQSCRGDEVEYGIESPPTSPTGFDTDAVTSPQRVTRSSFNRRSLSESIFQRELSWEDMLIAYSTLPGYVANRDHF